MTNETTSMTWHPSDPYQSVEGNPRIADHEVVWCAVCHDEAVVISNDGRQGLCWEHYEMLCDECGGE